VRVPFTMVQSVEETLSDPQNQYRNFFVPIEHEIAGQISYPTSPFRLKTAEWQALPAPILGQNNHEIYIEQLQLNSEQISKMKKEGVV
ncbi:MAG: CoA transferase, partial [Chloroflexota bacterium]|nr:CoA transferase [Chloroflexota bacterium]